MKPAPSSDTQYALVLLGLRVCTGLLMIGGHGMQKIQHFAEAAEHFPDPLGLGPVPSMACAILTEVGCSLLIMVGLLTRLACAGVLFTLFTIAIIVHRHDTWAQTEPSALFAVLYTTILCLGPGMFSLDFKLFAKRDSALKL